MYRVKPLVRGFEQVMVTTSLEFACNVPKSANPPGRKPVSLWKKNSADASEHSMTRMRVLCILVVNYLLKSKWFAD